MASQAMANRVAAKLSVPYTPSMATAQIQHIKGRLDVVAKMVPQGDFSAMSREMKQICDSCGRLAALLTDAKSDSD